MHIIAEAATQWPEAIALIGIAWAAVAGYAIWRFTGGKHDWEKRGK